VALTVPNIPPKFLLHQEQKGVIFAILKAPKREFSTLRQLRRGKQDFDGI
jgi:hypothetical protein